MTSSPSPGQLNTVSTMIEPFSSATKSRAAKVTTGSAAFLKACFQITCRSGRPLMRASLTYSLPRTSSMAERQRRAVAFQDEIERWAAEADGLPEVALQRARGEAPVLHGPGAIEPEVGAHHGDVRLARLRRRHDLDRVTGEAHEREDDHGH